MKTNYIELCIADFDIDINDLDYLNFKLDWTAFHKGEIRKSGARQKHNHLAGLVQFESSCFDFEEQIECLFDKFNTIENFENFIHSFNAKNTWIRFGVLIDNDYIADTGISHNTIKKLNRLKMGLEFWWLIKD